MTHKNYFFRQGLLFLFLLFFPRYGSAVYVWQDNEWSNEKDIRVVRALGNLLNEKKSHHFKNVPNIAISQLTFSITGIEDDKEKKLSFTIPHLFLSGWNKKNFTLGFGKDIEEFIRTELLQFDRDYVPFNITMIGNFFEDKEGAENDFANHLGKFLGEEIKTEDFPRDFYHSEQAAFLYIL